MRRRYQRSSSTSAAPLLPILLRVLGVLLVVLVVLTEHGFWILILRGGRHATRARLGRPSREGPHSRCLVRRARGGRFAPTRAGLQCVTLRGHSAADAETTTGSCMRPNAQGRKGVLGDLSTTGPQCGRGRSRMHCAHARQRSIQEWRAEPTTAPQSRCRCGRGEPSPGRCGG